MCIDRHALNYVHPCADPCSEHGHGADELTERLDRYDTILFEGPCFAESRTWTLRSFQNCGRILWIHLSYRDLHMVAWVTVAGALRH